MGEFVLVLLLDKTRGETEEDMRNHALAYFKEQGIPFEGEIALTRVSDEQLDAFLNRPDRSAMWPSHRYTPYLAIVEAPEFTEAWMNLSRWQLEHRKRERVAGPLQTLRPSAG